MTACSCGRSTWSRQEHFIFNIQKAKQWVSANGKLVFPRKWSCTKHISKNKLHVCSYVCGVVKFEEEEDKSTDTEAPSDDSASEVPDQSIHTPKQTAVAAAPHA